MKISQVLKDIRQQHQLTQEALAERFKASSSPPSSCSSMNCASSSRKKYGCRKKSKNLTTYRKDLNKHLV